MGKPALELGVAASNYSTCRRNSLLRRTVCCWVVLLVLWGLSLGLTVPSVVRSCTWGSIGTRAQDGALGVWPYGWEDASLGPVAGGGAGAGLIQGIGTTISSPCPEAGPCRILPLGDSITDGFRTPAGYRVELFRRAIAAGKDVVFVGGSLNGPPLVDGQHFPRNHEGHRGWTIERLDDIVPYPALLPDPHIILLHIGTNDLYREASGAIDRLRALIDQILTAKPRTLLVVSSLIPAASWMTEVRDFNSGIPAIVQTRAAHGARIVFVDNFSGFPQSELEDGLHPNTAGYTRMGAVWFAAIAPYLHSRPNSQSPVGAAVKVPSLD